MTKFRPMEKLWCYEHNEPKNEDGICPICQEGDQGDGYED